MERLLKNAQNLIINSSLNSLKGTDVVAPGWNTDSNLIKFTNAPDVHVSSGDFFYLWQWQMFIG
jgi:hypothetical protein